MAALMRIYLKRRTEFLEVQPNCAGCGQRSTEVHHMAGRVGDLLLDESRWLPACRDCHREWTDNPRKAIADGFSLPRIGRGDGDAA